MISIRCRQCEEAFDVPDSARGTRIECPSCGTHTLIPDPSKAYTQASRPARSGGVFDALLGNASQMPRGDAAKEVAHLLVPGEQIELAYKMIRDLFVFTDRRLILIDKQGMTGRKVECHSIPYRSIIHFSVETAGTFDRDAELKIYVSGRVAPIERQFRKGGANIFDVQRAIAMAVIGD